MFSVEGIIFLGVKLAQLALVVLIPLFYGRIGDIALSRFRNHEYIAIPVLVRVSHLNGVMLGLALLYFSPHAAQYNVERVFTDPGPWSLNFTVFLSERVNPLTYSWAPMIDAVRHEGASLTLRIYMSVSVLFLVLVCVLSFVFWPPMLLDQMISGSETPKRRWATIMAGLWPPADALRSIVVSFGATLWSIYLTIYLINTLYWGMNLMNFWFLLLVAFIYQNYRYARNR